jgi:hypothetical protein
MTFNFKPHEVYEQGLFTDTDKPKNPETFPLTTDYFRGGMSLRDYFAAAAITGFIANPQNSGHVNFVAKVAYEVADAMLIVREEEKADD